MEARIMPKVSKAYILKINKPISNEYASIAASSCDKIELSWSYFHGYQDITGIEAWLRTGIRVNFKEDRPRNPNTDNERAGCCSASHAAIWKTISEGEDEAAIILEHDAMMLHPIEIDIPNSAIVVLGYKLTNPSRYDHQKAGPPKNLIDIIGHEGAHCYAITKKTAKMMIDEIETKGILGCIDNAYFLPRQRKTSMKIMIASPTPAIGWIRESTIWSRAATKNVSFIRSFSDHLS
jgi:GR25 family glycosyltransferase involved in LPS biosynthesis